MSAFGKYLMTRVIKFPEGWEGCTSIDRGSIDRSLGVDLALIQSKV